MRRALNRDLIIGIGIGLILASFFLFFFSIPPATIKKIEAVKKVPELAPVVLVKPKKEAVQPEPDQVPLKKEIVIPVGSGSEEIAAILVENGVIVSASKFLQATRESGAEYRLRAGSFILEENMTDTAAVLNILLSEPKK